MWQLDSFNEIADRIWRAVAEPEGVNIGLVAGKCGALIIDTGSYPDTGEAIRRAGEAIAGVPVVGAVVTHAHYDHIFGLAAFADLATYGHETTSELSDELATKLAELKLSQDDFVSPNVRFSLAKAIDLGGRYVELAHFGPAHTQGDIAIFVPDANVVFAGDLLETSGYPQFSNESSFNRWPAALDGILGTLNADTILVPGHGDCVNRDYAFEQRAQIAALYAQAQYLQQLRIPQAEALEKGSWPYPNAVIASLLPLLWEEVRATGKVPQI